MAPEQALGESTDACSDLFSLGVVLYEAATGRTPWYPQCTPRVVNQILRDGVESILASRPRFPLKLNDMILKLLSETPEGRYPSAAALIDAVDDFLGGWEDGHHSPGPGERLRDWVEVFRTRLLHSRRVTGYPQYPSSFQNHRGPSLPRPE